MLKKYRDALLTFTNGTNCRVKEITNLTREGNPFNDDYRKTELEKMNQQHSRDQSDAKAAIRQITAEYRKSLAEKRANAITNSEQVPELNMLKSDAPAKLTAPQLEAIANKYPRNDLVQMAVNQYSKAHQIYPDPGKMPASLDTTASALDKYEQSLDNYVDCYKYTPDYSKDGMSAFRKCMAAKGAEVIAKEILSNDNSVDSRLSRLEER